MFSKTFVKVVVYLMLFAMVSSVLLYGIGMFFG